MSRLTVFQIVQTLVLNLELERVREDCGVVKNRDVRDLDCGHVPFCLFRPAFQVSESLEPRNRTLPLPSLQSLP